MLGKGKPKVIFTWTKKLACQTFLPHRRLKPLIFSEKLTTHETRITKEQSFIKTTKQNMRMRKNI